MSNSYYEMLFKKKFAHLFLLLFVICSCSQLKQTDQLRVLFIGNSYTYYNSSPELFKALVLERFPEQNVETHLISQGGMTLEEHWKVEETINTIKSGNWDYVVLQEQSKLGMALIIDDDIHFGRTDLFFEYARKFDAEIKKSGAKTVFFMTWSERNKPEEQAILTHAYSTIANELDAILAPVGLVWNNVRTNESINLYDMDGTHPSPAGSYLAATTIYATLFGDNPKGLSGKISGRMLSNTGEASSDNQPLINISKVDANAIQKSVWMTLKASNKEGPYPIIEKPTLSYTLPTLIEGENIELNNILGKWYGTSTYGSNYIGQILNVENAEGKPEVTLSFYSADKKDQMRIENSVIYEDRLEVTIYDSLRTMRSILKLSLNDDKITGYSKSDGNITVYKHFNFSREHFQNETDLKILDLMMQTFESNIVKFGYVQAALDHYNQYSKLVGSDYKPDENYLIGVGNNYLNDNRVNDALNIFGLANTLYPQSINTYFSYVEALILAGRQDEALRSYKEAYELAKNTEHTDLSLIEMNLNRLEKGLPITNYSMAPAPPPPLIAQ